MKLKVGKLILILVMGIDVGVLNWGNIGGNIDILELIMINFKKKMIIMILILCDILIKVNIDEGVDYVKINVIY